VTLTVSEVPVNAARNRAATSGPQPCLVASAELDEAAWDGYVRDHAEATGYHLWQWRLLFERVFGLTTEYVAVRTGGRISGVLPLVHFSTRLSGRFVVSLPFVNYGGVLADDDASARLLIEAARTAGTRARASHVELRHRQQLFAELPHKQHKVAMILELGATPAELLAGVDRKARNQLKKAEKSGLRVVTGCGELVDDFYDVFAENMRDLGTPVYHRTFFRTVCDLFPDTLRVILIRQGDKAIAGGITYRFRDVIELPWASSLRSFNALCPNNMLYWSVIEQACAAGARRVDFGRCSPDQGTFKFKSQWGAKPSPLHWEYHLLRRASLPDQSPANAKYKLAIAIWKRLPLPVANRLGPRVIRQFPG
jgi:FemAB-related protein (PEP-CTERM system-associated)